MLQKIIIIVEMNYVSKYLKINDLFFPGVFRFIFIFYIFIHFTIKLSIFKSYNI